MLVENHYIPVTGKFRMERRLIRLDEKLYGCSECAWFHKCNYCSDTIRPRQEMIAKFHIHRCEQNSLGRPSTTNRRNSSEQVAGRPGLLTGHPNRVAIPKSGAIGATESAEAQSSVGPGMVWFPGQTPYEARLHRLSRILAPRYTTGNSEEQSPRPSTCCPPSLPTRWKRPR
jgi:hypothetical protein